MNQDRVTYESIGENGQQLQFTITWAGEESLPFLIDFAAFCHPRRFARYVEQRLKEYGPFVGRGDRAEESARDLWANDQFDRPLWGYWEYLKGADGHEAFVANMRAEQVDPLKTARRLVEGIVHEVLSRVGRTADIDWERWTNPKVEDSLARFMVTRLMACYEQEYARIQITTRASTGAPGYHGRNLLLFVTDKSEDMPQDLYDRIKTMLEIQTVGIDNVFTGGVLTSPGTMGGIGGSQWLSAQFDRYPVITVPERPGREVQLLLEEWIRFHLQDPSSTYRAGVGILIVEPDVTYTKALNSWRFAQALPSNTGIAEARRNLDSQGEQVRYVFELRGHHSYVENHREIGTNVLEGINRTLENPGYLSGVGYAGDITPFYK